MPKIDKAERRDAQRERERRGMQVTNRSMKTVIVPVIIKRGREARRKEVIND